MKTRIRLPKYDLSTIFFVILMLLPAINYYIAEIFWAFGLTNPISEIVYAFTFGIGLISVVRRLDLFRVSAIVVFVFLLAYSAVMTPQAVAEYTGPSFLKSPLAMFLLIYFPIFLLAADRRFKYEEALPLLSRLAVIPMILMIVAYVFQVYVRGTELHEYMSFAYVILPLILISLYYSWMSDGHYFGKILSILSAFTILFGGCRGALMTLLVFIVLSVLLFTKFSLKKVLLVFLGVAVVMNLSTILSYFGGQLYAVGIESRIFNFLDTGDIAESRDRLAVYRKALSIIDYYGHGIYSDRALLEHVESATYCHNWVLEFMVDYGAVLGGILVLLLLAKLAIIGFQTSSKSSTTHRFLMHFALSMLFVKFMLSNSYLNSSELALVFGWLIHLTRNKKQYQKYSIRDVKNIFINAQFKRRKTSPAAHRRNGSI